MLLSYLKYKVKCILFYLRNNKVLSGYKYDTYLGKEITVKIHSHKSVQAKINIGSRVTLGDRVSFELGPTGSITIGKNTWISRDCMIASFSEVNIGDDCLIGEFTSIRDQSHIFEDTNITINQQGITTKPIIIENDVWIGRGVAILKGVIIGKGSVIGANSVVNKSIEPYSIVAGIPARLIRKRKS